MRFYAPFITEATLQVTMALRSEPSELELELIQTQMTQNQMLRAVVGMRVRCANKTSAECIMRGRALAKNSRKKL